MGCTTHAVGRAASFFLVPGWEAACFIHKTTTVNCQWCLCVNELRLNYDQIFFFEQSKWIFLVAFTQISQCLEFSRANN